jgi:hypothetical protein
LFKSAAAVEHCSAGQTPGSSWETTKTLSSVFEKRGEVEPEDLKQRWYERNTGQATKDMQRRIHHPVRKWMVVFAL